MVGVGLDAVCNVSTWALKQQNRPKHVQTKSTDVSTFQPSNKTSNPSSSLNVASKFLIILNIFSYNISR